MCSVKTSWRTLPWKQREILFVWVPNIKQCILNYNQKIKEQNFLKSMCWLGHRGFNYDEELEQYIALAEGEHGYTEEQTLTYMLKTLLRLLQYQMDGPLKMPSYSKKLFIRLVETSGKFKKYYRTKVFAV
ncbi:hypothetical protein WA026_023026 [Henosepilachna vigintioctopunctata]|uniref:Uncharacterized protein n=1 Tax=Henosepilachna vigintioctopunctata TaxID=420089 RepID=A0AAW1VC52_9CUCU